MKRPRVRAALSFVLCAPRGCGSGDSRDFHLPPMQRLADAFAAMTASTVADLSCGEDAA